MHPNWLLLATVSALLSAGAAVAQKRTLFRMHALEFSFLVSATVLALSLFVPFTTDVFALPGRALAVLALKSALGGVAFLLVMTALERNPISNALPLLGLTPAVTAVLAQLVLHESLQRAQWFGLALMLAGTWALEARAPREPAPAAGGRFGSGRHRLMVGALLLFALSSVGDRLLLGGMKVPPNVVLFHQHVVYCLMYGGFLVVRRVPFAGVLQRGREQWPLLLGIAVLTLGYRFFQLQATRVGPVALVLAVKRTSIVYATFFGGRMFREERLAPRLAGAALIVAAGFLFLGRE
jgi:drug/metabolite transporter (DMT)-like permease